METKHVYLRSLVQSGKGESLLKPGFFGRWIARRTALLIVVCLIAMAVPAGAAGGKEPTLPMVSVAEIMEKDISPASDYVGHVEAIQTVDLRARVQGVLEKVNFTEGDFVQEGDVLYVIEKAPYQAQVDAKRALLQQAKAELTRAGQHLRRLKEARPEAIPATDLDNAIASELIARAQVASAEAALTSSELDLAYTTIVAPISGRIGRNAYTRGNLVGPSSGALARIVQMDPIRVVYSISETDLPAITAAINEAANGEKHRMLAPEIRLSGEERLQEKGRVSFVDNQVDPTTGTIAVRATFRNPKGRLIPGQYASVQVKAKTPMILPVVPQKAVMINRDGRFVLVVGNDGKVERRAVNIGQPAGPFWAVTQGLKPGEHVIVEGIQKVKPGQEVKAVLQTAAKEQEN